MSDAREQEIRALKDLLNSDGWLRFTESVRQQWQGEPFVGRMRLAVSGRQTEGQQAESIREVFAGRKAIEDVLTWPGQRLARLEAEATREIAGDAEIVRRA